MATIVAIIVQIGELAAGDPGKEQHLQKLASEDAGDDEMQDCGCRLSSNASIDIQRLGDDTRIEEGETDTTPAGKGIERNQEGAR